MLMDAAMEIDVQRTAGRPKGKRADGSAFCASAKCAGGGSNGRRTWREMPGGHLWFSKMGSPT
jgi:hypothetical protein